MKFKVMSFNLRYCNEGDGINIFYNRAPRILKTIKDELPDLIGFQEATDEMKSIIAKEISDTYVMVGCGRKANYRGESMVIAYRREVFELVGLETLWLSETPNVPGSRYSNVGQSGCPRFMIRAVLSPEGYEGVINFYNTHLDHHGATARVVEMKQVMNTITENGGAFVLTGDMNDVPESECIKVAAETEGVIDASAEVVHTFHNFGRITTNFKIDYIFTNGKGVNAYGVEDIPVEGVYISDHYPICAEIEL